MAAILPQVVVTSTLSYLFATAAAAILSYPHRKNRTGPFAAVVHPTL